jgi:DNA-binding beta-propeller fold protein YncE
LADDLDSNNSISFQQSAGAQTFKPGVVFSKPLINKDNTIQSISDADIIDHGGLPSWSANSNSWVQLKQAIAARVDINSACFDGGVIAFGSLGSDYAKWYGGVLALNGYIYGVPYNATTILKIDPDTDTATTFGSLAGTAKWVGGVLAPNGCIYCIPHTSTTILKIDPTTDAITTFGDLTGSTKWAGGVLAISGYIYCVPFDSTTILKIDPTTDTVTTFGSLTGTAKWVGGVLAPNDKIYCIPYDTNTVLALDPTTDTTTTFGDFAGLHKWSVASCH